MKTFIKSIILFTSFLTFSSFISLISNENQIEGYWYSKDVKNSFIQITKDKNKNVWSAKIIKSDEPDYIGKTLFRDCTYNIKSNNYSTIVTSPSMNADINATITISNNSMTIVGKKLLFTKTFNWVKIK